MNDYRKVLKPIDAPTATRHGYLRYQSAKIKLSERGSRIFVASRLIQKVE